jgi:hypothetical protein
MRAFGSARSCLDSPVRRPRLDERPARRIADLAAS